MREPSGQRNFHATRFQNLEDVVARMRRMETKTSGGQGSTSKCSTIEEGKNFRHVMLFEFLKGVTAGGAIKTFKNHSSFNCNEVICQI